MNPKLTDELLSRRAIIYVRQSSPGQVIHNQESQRRQYALVERARELGFKETVVIDRRSRALRIGLGREAGLSAPSRRSVHRRGRRHLLH